LFVLVVFYLLFPTLCTMQETKKCDLCGEEQEAGQQQGQFIDYGWSFNWLSFGHYGGFTDCIPDMNLGDVDSIGEYDPSPYMVHACHDCCVKLLELFPRLAEIAGVRGGHPNKNEHDSEDGTAVLPCCPYAWTWVRNPNAGDYENRYFTYLATPQLTWEIAPWETKAS